MKIESRLPLFDKPFYSYNFVLSDDDYKLRFRYSQRLDSYMIDIDNSNGRRVISGVRLVAGYPLLRQYVLQDIKGDLLLLPKKSESVDKWFVPNGRKVFQTHDLVYILPEGD